MKPLLIFFLTLAMLGCTRARSAHELFRWESVSDKSDSVLVALEWKFIEHEPVDSIAPLITRLDSLAGAGIDVRVPALFWKARILNREHHTKDARRLLNQAYQLNDSAKAPYTHARILFLKTVIDAPNIGKKHSMLKDCEAFFRSTGDDMMLATVSVDLGHIMREIGDIHRCLSYYLKADSLFEHLGVDTYHLKTSLNNLSILYEIGDTLAAKNIVESLIDNPKAIADSEFYTDVLLQKHMLTNDTSALLNAWRRIERNNYKFYDLRSAALDVARYNLDCGKTDEAGRLCSLVIDSLATKPDLEKVASAWKLRTLINERTGNTAGALECYRTYSAILDTLLRIRSAIEIGNIESRGEIAQSEAEITSLHKIERLWTGIFIMALVIAALIVAIILTKKVQSSRLAIARYQLDLEREQRSLVTSALMMEEKDNVLESVLGDIHKMEAEGRLKPDETRHLEQNVKLHLSGRQDWEHFRDLFEKVHPLFHRKLKESYPDLTEGDLRLATYIKIGMQGKQIARMLMLQPDTIRKNRQKLRRHLGLSSDQPLEDFLRSIDS